MPDSLLVDAAQRGEHPDRTAGRRAWAARLGESAFTAERAAVIVNGTEHAFTRTANGSYRYTAGEPALTVRAVGQ